jgi:hypothetical protein
MTGMWVFVNERILKWIQTNLDRHWNEWMKIVCFFSLFSSKYLKEWNGKVFKNA